MAILLRPAALRALLALAAVSVIGLVGWFAWDRYAERNAVTSPDAGGAAVTQIISARLTGASRLKVAELSGIVQASATDVRGLGWLRSDQIVKMPYSVDYLVDLSRIGSGQLEWHSETRTLIVDAPDVIAAAPNTDEGRRTLVRTTGLFVTREAGEQLSRHVSLKAAAEATREATSPERLAQARELGRRAVADLLAAPLAAAGMSDARVVVTFPPERRIRNRERWDSSRSVEEVLGNRR